MKSRQLLLACATELLEPLTNRLRAEGHRVQLAATGLDLLNKARLRLPDLIILDSILPDMDGSTACEILSRLPSTAAVPRLLLAAPVATFAEAPRFHVVTSDVPAPRFDSADLVRRVRDLLGMPLPVLDETPDPYLPTRELLNTQFP